MCLSLTADKFRLGSYAAARGVWIMRTREYGLRKFPTIFSPDVATMAAWAAMMELFCARSQKDSL